MSDFWTRNDGWILMSIYAVTNNGKAELWEIVGAADASNRAIPTVPELTSSFSKLFQYGMLEIEGERYGIKNSYREEIACMRSGQGGLFDSANKGMEWLNRANLSHANSDVVEITEMQAVEAYGIYTEKIRSERQ